jgi:hypothetical protein
MEGRVQVASCQAIKGSLIEETYAVFRDWDYQCSKTENLQRARAENTIGARSAAWARNVSWAISRRFDPAGRDRPLVELAKSGCDREVWKPLLLYHLTRDEFLVRDFLINWLYPRFMAGAYRLRAEDLLPYLSALSKKPGFKRPYSPNPEHRPPHPGLWSEATTQRVASGLLRLAVDFGLLTGTQSREFASYQLPERSFLYLLHAMRDREANARRLIDAEDWRLYLMDAADVERELLRLHQFRKLHYEVAGSLAQLKLPAVSAANYVKEMR